MNTINHFNKSIRQRKLREIGHKTIFFIRISNIAQLPSYVLHNEKAWNNASVLAANILL